MSEPINRRTMLRGIGATALFSLGPAPLLAGCGGNSGGNTTAASNAKVKLPVYLPYDGVKPDLPANDLGVTAGYLSYPAKPVVAIAEPPANGATVKAMTLTYAAVPPAMDRNQYWQDLNKRLGATLDVNVVPNANYADKLATVIAGGDLPDLVTFFAALKPAQFPALMRSKFTDLTGHLAGDAVKEYPFLANIPTQSWRNAVVTGGIYGIPIPRPLAGTVVLVRTDLARERGLSPQPKSFEEFRELCKGLTDGRRSRWAIGNPDVVLAFLEQMAGAPNMWREDGGKFTHHYETEEAKQALGDMLTLFKDGVIHPDAIGADTVQVQQWLQAGTIAINRDGFAAWANGMGDVQDPEKSLGGVLPPGRDGGKGTHWAGGGAFGMVGFRKADDARIGELLRICNWLAAPFGTAEYEFRTFGADGVHHTRANGEPVLTSKGQTELTVPVKYLSDAAPVLYNAGKANLTKAQHAFLEQLMPLAVADPTIGLFSDTQMSKGAQLDQKYTDTLRDIFAGRKPFSAWDQAVQDWRRNGGDQMRKEYEESFQAANR
jgi:putative aldouronate transport system substrate-binding protein